MTGKRAGRDRENWLLIKERDAAAQPGSGDAIVADNPLSAVSKRTIDEIAADRDRIWGPNGEEPGGEPGPARRSTGPAPADPAAMAGAKKAPLPTQPRPLLATSAAAAPDGPDWLHEIKPDGTTDFGHLQDAIANERTDPLVFYAFDLIHLDGWDLSGAGLEARKAALATLVPTDTADLLRYSDHQIGRGPEFFRHACSYRLEGIVSKRRDSPYRAGRHACWLKIKCANREEFVVIGFSDPEGARLGLGALLLGYYDRDGELRYAGRVGTGFRDAQLTDLRRRLEPLVQARRPVKTLPPGAVVKGVHWTAPQLVAEIRYGGWTPDAVLRHATFLGLREDKPARE